MIDRPPDSEIIRRLLEKLGDGDAPIFNKEEAAALQVIAQTYIGLRAFGRLAGVVKTIFMWFGWALVLLIALKSGSIEFIKGAVK